MVRDLGVFAVGNSVEAAAIAGDLYQHTAEVKALSLRLGRYRTLDNADLFDVEYWSLEQAKLGKSKEKPLQRKVALVTGAGGAIGSAIVAALARDGAAVVALDLKADALAKVVDQTCAVAGVGSCVGVVADVTDEVSMANAFAEACDTYGGIDIVVLNAGITRSAPIDQLSIDDWNLVLDVNLTGYFLTLREAVRLFKRQRMGGNVVVIASKNAFAPGPEFAAYSVSKGGGHQLGRLAAIELAPLGVRVNMINPDAIFGHGDVAVGPVAADRRGARAHARHDDGRPARVLPQAQPAQGAARRLRRRARRPLLRARGDAHDRRDAAGGRRPARSIPAVARTARRLPGFRADSRSRPCFGTTHASQRTASHCDSAGCDPHAWELSLARRALERATPVGRRRRSALDAIEAAQILDVAGEVEPPSVPGDESATVVAAAVLRQECIELQRAIPVRSIAGARGRRQRREQIARPRGRRIDRGDRLGIEIDRRADA